MIVDRFARSAGAVLLALVVATGAGRAVAETAPSPAAVLLAKEIVTLKKGQFGIWEAIVPGVIEQAKNVFLQTNPALSKELNDVATQLRAEYAARTNELFDIVAVLYAQQFTESELKELVAFYRSPLGAKVLAGEPVIIDQSLNRIQQWANKFSEDVIVRIRAEMKKKGYDL